MPRLNDPSQLCPPDSNNRKALEKRAREATQPAVPQDKGRWPFPVNQPAGNAPAAGAGPDADKPEPPVQPDKPQGPA
jgi:hypothetical protein